MLRPSKLATSIRASVVSSPTSASSAPIIPAITSPRSSSAITSVSSSSERVEPSRSVIFSCALPRLTTMPSRTLAASKAWMGWPVSSIT
jgi:hypothetical protein